MAAAPSRAIASIVARIGAATIGGYICSYSVAAALSRVLPIARSEVVILTALLAIVLHLIIAVSAFGCRSIAWFWLVLLTITAPLYALSFWYLS